MNYDAIDYELVGRWIFPIMWTFVGMALVFFVWSIMWALSIGKKIDKDGGKANKKRTYYLLDVPYTAFIVIISLFPLLGMLGTVSSLITLDISSGETEALKDNFFLALKTTGLGLILAIFFKLLNAFFQPLIEGSIAKAKKLLEKGEEDEQTRDNP